MSNLEKDIVRCRYRWGNGHKKKYSGFLNHWSKNIFVYQQRKILHFDLIPENIRHNLSRRKQIRYCIDKKLYSLPIYAYDQLVLAIELFEYRNYNRLYFLSGDDDILDLSFGKEFDIKKFVLDNFMKDDFENLLWGVSMENN